MIKKYFPFIFLLIATAAFSQKILFDATKVEMAGSADWVIDADVHNLYTNNALNIGGAESNPQRYPLPLQSAAITLLTPETYWTGALSYWALDCVRQGYTLESLPWNGRITYGDATNAQDLSNYKVYVVDEPNIEFSLSEKNAIVNFVKNGGGLMMISDHYGSDRNNDGKESLVIWNELMINNTVQINPFGISFDALADVSQTSNNVANLSTNQILHGPSLPITCSICGNVTAAKWSRGTTMTLNPSVNSSVTGLIFKTGSSTTGTTNVMCASATYLAGRVVAIGDSSIADDGSGDPSDVLYDGYITDAGGNHQKLLMNAIVWLMNSTMKTNDFETSQPSLTIAPNPIANKELKVYIKNTSSLVSELTIYDATGRQVKQVQLSENPSAEFQIINCEELQSGIYFGRLQTDSFSKSIPFSILN